MTPDDPRAGPSAHLGDALSALLDGELSDADTAAARAHLAACPTCEAELGAIGQARTWLRGLPPVEPPADFFERLITGSVPERSAGSVPERSAGSVPERSAGSVPERSAGSVPERSAGHEATVTPLSGAPSLRRRWRAGVAAMSACAAVTVVVLSVAAPHDPPTSPPLGRFIVAHETEVGVGDPVSELATAVVPAGFQR